MRVIEFEGIPNVRDLGGIALSNGRRVKRGLVFRGSALNGATPADMRKLSSVHGVKTVIDLRCGWELEAKPNATHPEIRSMHIPYFDQEIVGVDYTQAAQGTKKVGNDFACDPDHFYRAMANPLTVGQMRKALHTVFDEARVGTPVYFHCSGGKDRAGILTVLMLSILGAHEDEIMNDYLFTNVSRDKEYDKLLQRFLKFTDGDVEHADRLVKDHRARPENIWAFKEAVDSEYGSFEAFIERELGFDEAAREAVRNVCTCSPSQQAHRGRQARSATADARSTVEV